MGRGEVGREFVAWVLNPRVLKPKTRVKNLCRELISMPVRTVQNWVEEKWRIKWIFLAYLTTTVYHTTLRLAAPNPRLCEGPSARLDGSVPQWQKDQKARSFVFG